MKSNKIVLFLIIGLLVVTSAILASRNAQNKPLPQQPNQNQGQNEFLPNQTPGLGGQSLSLPGSNQSNGDMQRAGKLSQQIVAIGNIKRAPVIVDGNRAIVGIELVDDTSNGINNMAKSLQNRNTNTVPSPDNTGINNGMVPGIPDTSIKLSPNNDANANNMDVKGLIEQRVRAIDPGVTNVLVTTDNKMIDRIQNLNSSVSKETEDIVNKLQNAKQVR